MIHARTKGSYIPALPEKGPTQNASRRHHSLDAGSVVTLFAIQNRQGAVRFLITIALVLASLLGSQASRSVLMASGGKEQLSFPPPQATVNILVQNEWPSSEKPQHFPYGMAKIAFERNGVVYLYNAETKETRRIAKGGEPNISSDGDRIAFTADRDDSLKNRTIKLFSLKTNSISEIQSLGQLHSR